MRRRRPPLRRRVRPRARVRPPSRQRMPGNPRGRPRTRRKDRPPMAQCRPVPCPAPPGRCRRSRASPPRRGDRTGSGCGAAAAGPGGDDRLRPASGPSGLSFKSVPRDIPAGDFSPPCHAAKRPRGDAQFDQYSQFKRQFLQNPGQNLQKLQVHPDRVTGAGRPARFVPMQPRKNRTETAGLPVARVSTGHRFQGIISRASHFAKAQDRAPALLLDDWQDPLRRLAPHAAIGEQPQTVADGQLKLHRKKLIIKSLVRS